MKTVEQIFEELIATMERNAIDNKAEITNVKLWANSWREELRQFGVIKSVCDKCGVEVTNMQPICKKCGFNCMSGEQTVL